MDLQAPRSPTSPGPAEKRERRIAVSWFGLARVGAGLLILLTVVLFVIYSPRFGRSYWQWDTVRMALAFGLLSRHGWALYLVGMQYIVAGVSILAGLLVYAKRVLPRRSSDWAGLVASLTLATGLLLMKRCRRNVLSFGPEPHPIELLSAGRLSSIRGRVEEAHERTI